MKVLLWVVAIGAALNTLVGVLSFGPTDVDTLYAGMGRQEIVDFMSGMYIVAACGCTFAIGVWAAAATRYPVVRKHCGWVIFMTGCFTAMYLFNAITVHFATDTQLLSHLAPSAFTQLIAIVASLMVTLATGVIAILPEHDLKEGQKSQ